MDSPNGGNEMFVVHIPAHVVNSEAAIERLGGLDECTNAYEHEQHPLQFNLAPSVPYARPMEASRTPVTNLVLKVTRKLVKRVYADGRQETITQIEPTVVGPVKQQVVFDGLCDFQYLPEAEPLTLFKTDPGDDLDQFFDDARAELDSDPSDKLRIMPTTLGVKYPTPMLHSRSMRNVLRGAGRAKLSASVGQADPPLDSTEDRPPAAPKPKPKARENSSSHAATIELHDPVCPPHTGPIASARRRGDGSDELLMSDIAYLFEQRPAWTYRQLSFRLGELAKDRGASLSTAQLKRLASYYMYTFAKGPFKMSIRRGYDPRTDPTAAFLQMLDYRCRSGPVHDVAAAFKALPATSPSRRIRDLIAMTESHMSLLGVRAVRNHAGVTSLTFQHQATFQVADLMFVPAVRQVMDGYVANMADAEYNPLTGWLTAAQLDACRAGLKEHIEGAAQRLLAVLDQDAPIDPTVLAPLEDYRDRPPAMDAAVDALLGAEGGSDIEPADIDDYTVADVLAMIDNSARLVI